MALTVVWSHSFALYFGSEDTEPVSVLLSGVYNAGNIAVRVFFVVSGFLITQSLLNSRTPLSYFSRRVSRIFPGYVVCVAVTSLVIIPVFAPSVSLGIVQVIKSVASAFVLREDYPPSDIFSLNPVSAINGSLWSISFEFWCYVGVMIIGILGVVRYKFLAVALIISLMLSKAVLDYFGIRPGLGIFDDVFGWNYIWLDIGPYFLCGSLAYLMRGVLPRNGLALLAAILLFIGLAQWNGIVARAVFPFTLTYAVLFFAFSEVRFPDFAKHDYSYGAYLYAFPLQQLLVAAKLPFYGYVAISMIGSLAAGAASWYLIERHFIRRSHPIGNEIRELPLRV